MRFCRNCGSKADDSALYCMKCGAEITDRFDRVTSLVKPHSPVRPVSMAPFDQRELQKEAVQKLAVTLKKAAQTQVLRSTQSPAQPAYQQSTAQGGAVRAQSPVQTAYQQSGAQSAAVGAQSPAQPVYQQSGAQSGAVRAQSPAQTAYQQSGAQSGAVRAQSPAQPAYQQNGAQSGAVGAQSPAQPAYQQNGAVRAQSPAQPAYQQSGAVRQPANTGHAYSRAAYTPPQTSQKKKNPAASLIIAVTVIIIISLFLAMHDSLSEVKSTRPSYTAATVPTVDIDLEDIDIVIPDYVTDNEKKIYGVYATKGAVNTYWIIRDNRVTVIEGRTWVNYQANVFSPSPSNKNSLCRLDAGDLGDFTVYQSNKAFTFEDEEREIEYTLYQCADWDDLNDNEYIGLWYSYAATGVMLVTDWNFVVYNGTQRNYDLTGDGIMVYAGNSQIHQYTFDGYELERCDVEADQAYSYIKLN